MFREEIQSLLPLIETAFVSLKGVNISDPRVLEELVGRNKIVATVIKEFRDKHQKRLNNDLAMSRALLEQVTIFRQLSEAFDALIGRQLSTSQRKGLVEAADDCSRRSLQLVPPLNENILKGNFEKVTAILSEYGAYLKNLVMCLSSAIDKPISTLTNTDLPLLSNSISDSVSKQMQAVGDQNKLMEELMEARKEMSSLRQSLRDTETKLHDTERGLKESNREVSILRKKLALKDAEFVDVCHQWQQRLDQVKQQQQPRQGSTTRPHSPAIRPTSGCNFSPGQDGDQSTRKKDDLLAVTGQSFTYNYATVNHSMQLSSSNHQSSTPSSTRFSIMPAGFIKKRRDNHQLPPLIGRNPGNAPSNTTNTEMATTRNDNGNNKKKIIGNNASSYALPVVSFPFPANEEEAGLLKGKGLLMPIPKTSLSIEEGTTPAIILSTA